MCPGQRAGRVGSAGRLPLVQLSCGHLLSPASDKPLAVLSHLLVCFALRCTREELAGSCEMRVGCGAGSSPER